MDRAERCDDCYWWKRHQGNTGGECMRFPQIVCKAPDSYCGEYEFDVERLQAALKGWQGNA